MPSHARKRGYLPGTILPLAFLTSPFQLGVSTASALLGLGILLSTVLPGVMMFTALQALVPPLVVIVWASFLFAGGPGVAAATFLAEGSPPKATALEIPALALLGTAWLVYAAVPILTHALLASLPIGLCVAAACYLRIRGIMVAARVTRDVVSTVGEGA